MLQSQNKKRGQKGLESNVGRQGCKKGLAKKKHLGLLSDNGPNSSESSEHEPLLGCFANPGNTSLAKKTNNPSTTGIFGYPHTKTKPKHTETLQSELKEQDLYNFFLEWNKFKHKE